ncbi:MAG TPA: bifunctional adenosylcobinamide kinase/adenosylcobinamide-phosphate guanylyltransferase [Polyangiaceae bacterium]
MDEHERRIVLIGGGTRSGKSSFAVELGQSFGERRAFVATARPTDEEMRARIDRHRRDRQDTYTTFEETLDLPTAVRSLVGYEVVVIDCLTLWLSNLLLRRDSAEAILERVDDLVRVLQERHFHTVLVTNEVGMSVHPGTALGRAFVDICGFAHQRLARAADEVYLAILGTVIRIRSGRDRGFIPAFAPSAELGGG